MNNAVKQYMDQAVELYGYDRVFESCVLNEDVKGFIIGLAMLGTLSYATLKRCENSDSFSDLEKDRIETIMAKDNITPDDIPNYNKKVQAVEQYMEDAMKLRYGYKKAANGKPAWINEYNKITLTAEHLVLTCAKYRYDLPLALATAYHESIFGTSKRCHDGINGKKPTHSVWSVGSYDNGSNKSYYKDDNASLEPYIQLMLRQYLADKTVDQAFKAGELVNSSGNRYASDPNYEVNIAATRKKILNNYPDLADTKESTWNLDPEVLDFAQAMRDADSTAKTTVTIPDRRV